jgi:hypothetical protein
MVAIGHMVAFAAMRRPIYLRVVASPVPRTSSQARSLTTSAAEGPCRARAGLRASPRTFPSASRILQEAQVRG